ncbi:hypothetical protein OSTOST_14752 [Ostertagia ostertagi]
MVPENCKLKRKHMRSNFADKVVVNFQCSVRLDLRGETECPIPACEDPIKFERRLRPRSAGFIHEIPIFDANGSVEVDVRAQQIDVLDPQIDFGFDADDKRMRSVLQRLRGDRDCIAKHHLIIPAATAISLIISLIGVVFILLKRSYPRKP